MSFENTVGKGEIWKSEKFGCLKAETQLHLHIITGIFYTIFSLDYNVNIF